MIERDIAALTAADFSAHAGQTFAIADAPDAFSLTLQAVREPSSYSARVNRAPFALDFTGSTAAPLRQGTYRLQNDAFGSVEIFLVPVGEKHESRFYEAIFS